MAPGNMKFINEETFLSWAKNRGIGLDVKYSPPQELKFIKQNYFETTKFWSLKDTRPLWLFDKIIHLLKPCEYWRVWKRWPKWGVARDDSEKTPEDIIEAFLRYKDFVPSGFTGAIELEKNEYDYLIRVFYSQATFGFTARDDLFIIPEHGEYIINWSHDEELAVMMPDKSKLEILDQKLKKMGVNSEE